MENILTLRDVEDADRLVEAMAGVKKGSKVAPFSFTNFVSHRAFCASCTSWQYLIGVQSASKVLCFACYA